MSAIEYNSLVFKISQRVDELNVLSYLRFMFRGRLASGSEDNIHDALSLFKELEELNILGADRLVEMKELLSDVEEWSLLEKVEKFESKRKEYRDLLEQIILALDELNELERLIAMCRGKISEESEGRIHDVRSLFKELENQNNLGIYHLDILKAILAEMKNNELLKKVEKFEEGRKQEAAIKRKKGKATALLSSVGNTLTAQSVGIVSSLKRMATCIKGAVKLVCNFRTIARGLLVVNSGMALRKCSSLDEFVEVFNKVVLVSYSKLVEISEGSLCFTVQAETSSALKELWDMYKGGTLQNRLQDFLVTDEIKQLASGEDVEVTVYIDEEEYKAAYLDLMLLQKEEGKKHDASMLVDSNLLRELEQNAFSPTGEPMCVFGDPAYPLSVHLQAPFRHGILTPVMEAYNAEMSSVRVTVEWLFGDIINDFKFLDFKKNLKIGMSSVGKMYLVCAILNNAITCLYGNSTSEFFGLNPPSLQDYFT